MIVLTPQFVFLTTGAGALMILAGLGLLCAKVPKISRRAV